MIYCYDIDGTICTNTDGDYEHAVPFPHVIEEVNARYEAGHTILFFTARGSTTGIDWRELTERQLRAWNVKYHELRLGKPHADVYIDDKSFNPVTRSMPTPQKTVSKADLAPGEQSPMESAAYLELTYAENRLPKTEYPAQLAAHLRDSWYHGTGRLLDLGCGRGDFLRAFHQAGMEVFGTDLSPMAPEYGKPFPVVSLDIEKDEIPYPAASFDCIFSKSVLEHLRNPITLARKAFAALKPGGTCLLMTPAWEYTYWGPFYIDHTHVSPFSAPSLADLMTLAGFTDVEVSYFYQLPFLWKHPHLAPLVKLLALLPVPYRPMNPTAPWPDHLNTLLRFSKEVMLLGVGKKHPAGVR